MDKNTKEVVITISDEQTTLSKLADLQFNRFEYVLLAVTLAAYAIALGWLALSVSPYAAPQDHLMLMYDDKFHLAMKDCKPMKTDSNQGVQHE